MKFIKRQILDEREEQLVNKAGMEAFSFLMASNLTFYIGSIFIHSIPILFGELPAARS